MIEIVLLRYVTVAAFWSCMPNIAYSQSVHISSDNSTAPVLSGIKQLEGSLKKADILFRRLTLQGNQRTLTIEVTSNAKVKTIRPGNLC